MERAAPIPAYAHNDYENEHPLFDAIALGCLGVEVDVHLVNGELRVGHDRTETRPGRTLRALYLQPLLARVVGSGADTTRGMERGLPPGFLLLIEDKTHTDASVDSVLADLGRSEPVTTGGVRVILVGPLTRPQVLRAARNPHVEFQVRVSTSGVRGDSQGTVSPERVGLVSLDYEREIRWDGVGPPPQRSLELLRQLRRVRDRYPGARSRVHGPPANARVLQFLLDSGVDLIGTKELAATAPLLPKANLVRSDPRR